MAPAIMDIHQAYEVSSGSAGPPEYSESIEERCFTAALACLEGHYTGSPPMGPQTTAKVSAMIARTLEKTHTHKQVREILSQNVSIWVWLTRIFAAAIPVLTTRAVGPLPCSNDSSKIPPPEGSALIVRNYLSLKEDLPILNKLMHIARNLLVTSEPEVPQDICAAAHFDQMVYQTFILCVSVTSKGYDGDIDDGPLRSKFEEIWELFKKLLVSSLQQAHNWTVKHDRNKMSFWLDMLFDDDPTTDRMIRSDVARTEIQHWLERNSRLCVKARKLLSDYARYLGNKKPGILAPISPLAWNWLPEGSIELNANDPDDVPRVKSARKADDDEKYQKDKEYGRVSKEIDDWWLRVRDPNHDDWVTQMTTIQAAHERTEQCKAQHEQRIALSKKAMDHLHHEHDPAVGDDQNHELSHGDTVDDPHFECDEDDIPYEDDGMDHDSDDDGILPGMLAEIPNILDPKQIEALHMIIKSCILDSAGSGPNKRGESLQKTRCRMLLAVDAGKSILRELLVFIAVWEQEEQSLIFQLTCQIVEAVLHNDLIPYAWDCFRIPKDIISPPQAVLLRILNFLLRRRLGNLSSREESRDAKVAHRLFDFFRSRVVPETTALMHIQTKIREGKLDPSDCPIDLWDFERTKEGLAQYLDFLTTVAEIPTLRTLMIDWECIYDFIVLLTALEAAVVKKALVEVPDRSFHGFPTTIRSVERPYSTEESNTHTHPPPPMLEPAHKFPWAGIKGSIFTIIATLLQPPPGQSSPGNPKVQDQLLRHNGMVPLLNSVTYDDHNPYAKERVTICLKWLLDGSEKANDWFRELVKNVPMEAYSRNSGESGSADGGRVATVRVDGISADIKIQVRTQDMVPPQPGAIEAQHGTFPASQIAAQLSIQPTAQLCIQPTAQLGIQPIAQLNIPSSMQSIMHPSMQSIMQPTIQQTTQPAAQETVQPVTQPSTQPATEQSTQPTTEQAMDSGVEADGQSGAQSGPQTAEKQKKKKKKQDKKNRLEDVGDIIPPMAKLGLGTGGGNGGITSMEEDFM